jgi:hypothetical protein
MAGKHKIKSNENGLVAMIADEVNTTLLEDALEFSIFIRINHKKCCINF